MANKTVHFFLNPGVLHFIKFGWKIVCDVTSYIGLGRNYLHIEHTRGVVLQSIII